MQQRPQSGGESPCLQNVTDCKIKKLQSAHARAIARLLSTRDQRAPECPCSGDRLLGQMRECFQAGSYWQDAMDQGPEEPSDE